MSPNTHAWLILTLTPGLGPTRIARLVEHAGGAAHVLGSNAQMLAEIDGLSQKGADKIRQAIDTVCAGDVLKRELDQVREQDVALFTLEDAGYPALLKTIPAAPPILWVKGKLDPGDALSLAIVGSRKCSHYGKEQADQLANALAHSGVTIVSGGAYGIDIAAHRGALRAAKSGNGRTIAVLGSGLNRPYPSEHVGVFDSVAEDDGAYGAVISEFPMSAGPRPENFLRRNRIISGLCVGTLVIEAGKRSGALSTARRCVDEQGRELMALPGRVDSAYSAGCHQIIREGWGRLVTGVSDVLDQLSDSASLLDAALEIAGEPVVEAVKVSAETSPILEILDTPRSLDEVVSWTGMAAAEVQTELTMLEIRGAVTRQGGLFVKRRG